MIEFETHLLHNSSRRRGNRLPDLAGDLEVVSKDSVIDVRMFENLLRQFVLMIDSRWESCCSAAWCSCRSSSRHFWDTPLSSLGLRFRREVLSCSLKCPSWASLTQQGASTQPDRFRLVGLVHRHVLFHEADLTCRSSFQAAVYGCASPR